MRVAIVEEHEIFRRGVASALADHDALTVVYAGFPGPDPAEADVVVASPAGQASVGADCRVVVCVDAGRHRPPDIRGNVYAVLPRAQLTPEQLVAAVFAAGQGFRLTTTTSAAPASPLDARKRAVLELLAEGARTRDISDALGYSERTIKAVIQDLEHHLGARSRAQAVALGIRQGLI